MSTSAGTPFRSFVQTPIFSVFTWRLRVSRRYSNKHHHRVFTCIDKPKTKARSKRERWFAKAFEHNFAKERHQGGPSRAHGYTEHACKSVSLALTRSWQHAPASGVDGEDQSGGHDGQR